MSGRAAWGVMAAGIVFYEIACDESELLSVVVDDWLASRPILTRAVIIGVASHLINLVDPKLDPMHLAFLGGRKLARMVRR